MGIVGKESWRRDIRNWTLQTYCLFLIEAVGTENVSFPKPVSVALWPVDCSHHLSHLRFVDSSGLGAMLSCLRQLNATGGDLKLCGMSKAVRSVFELVRMHRIFDIYDTREQAVSAFQH